ncbi:MAG: UDP-3-O-[3-hydroxymyristoyl] N-acetylglucosamine deacetylase, partial [Actinobacteria bacterium]|nr:UDP-3-O-[3-hydroxymyristoyl] N-acetylglucosamine deacetylase [Actinomycetota bacterium]
MTLHPAPVDTSIVFRRVDLPNAPEMKVSPELVTDTRMCSALQYEGVRVATVEHLMSALCGLGIDNVWLDLDAAEVPILDGSSSPFVFLIQSAGIVEQNVPKRFLRIKKPVEIKEGDKIARLSPYEG